jgi:hypothetical protein
MTRDRLEAALAAAKATPKLDRVLTIRMATAEFDRLAAVAEARSIATAALARLLIMDGLVELEGRGKGRA